MGGSTGDRAESRYVLFLDPLDGSSNLDANLTVGSIFSIHLWPSRSHHDLSVELLKRGADQIAAGYMLYGPSTLLVYTCGAGVYQFTLDRRIGEFVLSGSRLQMPSRGKVYGANDGNYAKWPREVQRFVDYLRDNDGTSGRSYATRYSGCLVADVHRFKKKVRDGCPKTSREEIQNYARGFEVSQNRIHRLFGISKGTSYYRRKAIRRFVSSL